MKTVCCICTPETDHNGMPCWKCWCAARAVVVAANQLSEAIGRLPADEVAGAGLNPAWFHLRGTIKAFKERSKA